MVLVSEDHARVLWTFRTAVFFRWRSDLAGFLQPIRIVGIFDCLRLCGVQLNLMKTPANKIYNDVCTFNYQICKYNYCAQNNKILQ